MQTIGLAHNRPLRVAGRLTLECREGLVWLTHTGRPGDVFLHPGERYVLDGSGDVLIEALGTARVVLQVAPSPWRYLRRAGRFLLSSLHDGMRALRKFGRRDSLAG